MRRATETTMRARPHKIFSCSKRLLGYASGYNVTPMLVGPDVTRGHGQDHSQYLLDFANECKRLGVEIGALTHHEYIEVEQDQPSNTPFSSSKLDETAVAAAVFNATASRAGIPLWAGEIGPHNGGSPPCDHTSERGHGLPTLFGLGQWQRRPSMDTLHLPPRFRWYRLWVADCATYEPLPYYGGVLWSRLMGTGVSYTPNPSTMIRAYGHCHPTSPMT